MKKILAIDTATDCASLALSYEGQLIVKTQAGQKTHAQLILPMIDALLCQAALTVAELDAIVFGRGPGSFTGLRVACSIAKGLAYAHDLPLIPVSSLAAIAWEAKKVQQDGKANVLAVLDARMQEVYWALFSPVQLSTEEQVSPASALQLSGVNSIHLAGVGFANYEPFFPQNVLALIHQRTLVYPRASALIELAEAGEFKAISVAEAQPVYLRNQVTQGRSCG